MRPPLIDPDRLQAAVGRRNDALAAVRKAALDRFLETNLPSTRVEAWKYTNLAPIAASSDAWLGEEDDAPAPADDLRPPGIDAHWLTIANGRVDDRALAALNTELGDSVRIGRLSEHPTPPAVFTGDALSSLNAALMHDALCIDIAADARPEKPIGLCLTDSVAGAATSQVRVLIRAGENARAEIVEWHGSCGHAEHFAGLVTEVDLQDRAQLALARVQERAPQHSLVSRVQATLARDSEFRHAAIELGGSLIRTDVEGHLAAAGARFESSGVLLADGREHMDSHVAAMHRVGPTRSRQNYRGIAGGRSRCVFNGKAFVQEGADGTDAEQTSHNLLLSDRAEIDTKPELEIYAEDVRCSHGATVGRLDRQALFYLLSRGIARGEARRLLIRAFAADVIAELPVAAYREFAEQATDRKLARLVDEAET